MTASLDQPVGSIVEGRDGPGTDDAVRAEPDGHSTNDAVRGPVDRTESGATVPSAPSAPPAPAWLIRPPRRISRNKAILALASMALVSLGLACTAAILALKGFAAGSAGTPASPAAQLVFPAPGSADGLPLHSAVVRNQGTRRAIAGFRQRFDGLLSGPATAQPAGLYSEPGRADPVTGSPAWIMYLGFNERARLADPAAIVTLLMTRLEGPADRVRAWQVAAGPSGGIAKCAVAVIGQTQAAVCGWATAGTIGAMMSPLRDTSVSELAALMSLMRRDLAPG